MTCSGGLILGGSAKMYIYLIYLLYIEREQMWQNINNYSL